jgi:hypothetical protein
MTVWVESPVPATFIHLEKTGGTSVEHWLKRNTISHRVGKHSSHKKLLKWAQINDKSLGTVFSVIRNPYERELSWYMYIIQKTEHRIEVAKNRLPKNYSQKKIDTKYNIETNLKTLNEYKSKDGFKKMILESTVIVPQYPAVRNCDLILRLENIEKDFEKIKSLFNSTNNLPHKNQSVHKHYSNYYNEELKELVYKKHQIDFEQFGYTF